MNNELNYVDLIYPDLLPEDPIFAKLFPIEAAQPLPSVQDLKLITDSLANLEIASNTQSLRIEVERT